MQTIEIYKASAGSGKTFSLTLHFIELVLQSPNHYRRVLAVTFTNKATAEMKERILHVLAGLATGSNDVASYREQLLMRMPAFTPTLLQQQARQVYIAILHDYSRFSVATIDSFVQRIIRSFSWELGIDGGFKLQLSNDPVKEDLADRLYLRLDDDKDLQHWVIDMACSRLEDGKRWDFRKEMLELANEIFKEKFSLFEVALAKFSPNEMHEAFVSLNKKVNITKLAIQNKWKEAAAAIIQLIAAHHLQITDFHYGDKGFANYFFKLTNGVPIPLNIRALDALEKPEIMVPKKADATTKASIEAITPQLVAALTQFDAWYQPDIENYNTADAIQKNVGVLRLMRVFADELAAYRKENNALLISDTNKLLRELTKDTSAAFIYEKTGNRFQHYLIDEFQDTSGFQWDNFLPLLTEALAQGNYNLLVGDVKQAIYRFRNGDWRLLLNQAQQHLSAFNPTVKTLQENYRSETAIIQFNNVLFHIAPQLLQQQLNDAISEASSETQAALEKNGYHNVFTDAYADSYQHIPASAGNNGTVSIQFISSKDENDESVAYENEVLLQLYEKIKQLFAEGYSAKDMAILTRRNREAKMIVEYLVAAQQEDHLSFKIISGEALLLVSNQLIQMIICALRYVNDGTNMLALAQLRQLVLLQQDKEANSLEVFKSSGNNNILPYQFIHRIHQLRSLPLTELLHQLVLMFGWQHLPKHQSYLLAFCDKVQEWTRYGEASLQEFLHYWDDEGVKASLPATTAEDAIEVVTVHKSKGLAYRIVLMPFLNWEIVPKGGPIAPTIWAANSNTIFNEIPIVPVKYATSLANSSFSIDYYEELLLTAMDNLNTLYVAFTRAKERIYGWAKNTKSSEGKEKSKKNYSHIGALIEAVAVSTMPLPGPEYTETRAGFSADDLLWNYGEPATSTAAATPVPPAPLPVHVYADWRSRLKVKFRDLDDNDAEEVVMPRQQGILLHNILGRLQQPAQLPALLKAIQQEGWLENQQFNKVKNILEAVLKMDALKPWHQNQYKRLAERNMVNLTRQLRRPDLVLYNEHETIVYDFKFTATDTNQEKHQQQIAEYMQLLQQLGFTKVKGQVIYGLEQRAVAV